MNSNQNKIQENDSLRNKKRTIISSLILIRTFFEKQFISLPLRILQLQIFYYKNSTIRNMEPENRTLSIHLSYFKNRLNQKAKHVIDKKNFGGN